jgi:hypothetical protein
MLEAQKESLVTRPAVPTIFNMGVIAVILLGLLFVLLYSCGAIGPAKARLTIVIEWFVNVIVILLMLVVIGIAIMILKPELREPFVAIRLTVRRIALKLTLLLLDCLYIPICQGIIDIVHVDKRTCEVGEFLDWNRTAGDTFFQALYDQNVTCQPCQQMGSWSNDIFDVCNRSCNGAAEWHNNISQQLVFGPDVMGVTGPLMVYAALFVIIGQPIWWAYLIHANRDFAFALPCYGEDAETKWGWLADRLSSPGVFLFYQYKHNRPFWGFFLPISKLVCVVLVQITDFTSNGVSWALLIVYIAITALTVYFAPYRFPFNNIFDTVTSGSNVLLTILAVCNFHNANIPDSVQAPVTIILVVLPLLALVYGFVRKTRTTQPGETVTFDEKGKEVVELAENWEETRDLSWLLPIWNAIEHEEPAKERADELIEGSITSAPGQDIHITSEFVNGRLAECQEMVDSICDAYSTYHVVTLMKGATLIACCCAGWFFGGIAGRHDAAREYAC